MSQTQTASLFYTVAQAEEAGWGDDALYFATFMNAVNAVVWEKTGMSIDDFPDWSWADAFTGGDPVDGVVQNFLNDMTSGGRYA